MADGHDALHVLDVGLQGQPDDVIMGEARSNHRILLTSDTDFGELLWRSSERFPSVLLLRRHSRLIENQAAVILANPEAVADDISILTPRLSLPMNW